MQYLSSVLANNAPVLILFAWGFWKLDRRLVAIEQKVKTTVAE